MAVVDKYVNADTEAGLKPQVFFTNGEETLTVRNTFEIAAGDDDTSVYRIFNGIPTHYRIVSINIYNDALTAGTDYDLGFYNVNYGTVIDADILMNGGDLSSAHAVGSPLIGTSALDLPDYVEPIWSLIGDDRFTAPHAVDIVLTANTVGTAGGTVLVDAVFSPVNG